MAAVQVKEFKGVVLKYPQIQHKEVLKVKKNMIDEYGEENIDDDFRDYLDGNLFSLKKAVDPKNSVHVIVNTDRVFVGYAYDRCHTDIDNFDFVPIAVADPKKLELNDEKQAQLKEVVDLFCASNSELDIKTLTLVSAYSY